MKWHKTGAIYTTPGDRDWRVSHAQHPTVDRQSEDVLRVYFATRDAANRSVTTFIDIDANNPQTILYEHDRPILGLGELGCFDDAGAMPSWVVNRGGIKYLYYIGWNTGVSVPYRNSIGLALSDDGGRSFTRAYRGPVVDRRATEPHFCGGHCILVDQGQWRMWYLSSIGWATVDGKPEPLYHIKMADSLDGRDWRQRGVVAIDLKSASEGGIARPCVLRDAKGYRMWYSYRGVADYRTNKDHSYRVGYATSEDGVVWTRRDDFAGIDVSVDGWDSEMITYAHVYRHKGTLHMIYNGNGFGHSGFGHAVLG